ncbi:MAG TPA: hypothetical protein VMT17_11125 [Anaeromyxobacteraceae bacterium]|nr:hypothetical protein [Anaeromyxobacteraceae bacterium]
MGTFVTLRKVAAVAIAIAPLAGQARGPGCRLPVTIGPAALEAGTVQAQVRVETDGAVPRLVASSGQIRNLRPEGTSAYVADYFPANPADPKVALIAAGLENGACGFTAIRVAGRTATRAAGPVALLLRPNVVPADQEVDVTVLVFALDESGRPWPGRAPALAVSNGTISKPESAGAGAWSARWRVVPQEGRAATVAASLPEGATFTASLDRQAGPVAALRIEFDRPTAAPGDPRPVTVTVLARDSAGNLTDAEVSLESDLGGLGDLARTEQGIYRAPLLVAPALRGDRAITLEARAGAISEQAVLVLAAGAAEAISIIAPESVPSDGRAVRQITVEVADAFGNPVEDEKLTVESKLGEEVGQPVRVAPGRWIASYKARWSQQDEDDVVTVRAGAITATKRIALVGPTPRFSFAPKVGAVLQSGAVAFCPSFDAAAWTRLGSEQVGLSLEVSWWELSNTGQTSTSSGTFDYTNSRNYVPLVLNLAWRRPIGSSTILWARLGGGGAWVQATSSVSGQPSVAQSGWAPTASAALAFGARVWGGFPFLEVRVGWVGNPNLANLNGSVVPIFLFAGYRFDAG